MLGVKQMGDYWRGPQHSEGLEKTEMTVRERAQWHPELGESRSHLLIGFGWSRTGKVMLELEQVVMARSFETDEIYLRCSIDAER